VGARKILNIFTAQRGHRSKRAECGYSFVWDPKIRQDDFNAEHHFHFLGLQRL